MPNLARTFATALCALAFAGEASAQRLANGRPASLRAIVEARGASPAVPAQPTPAEPTPAESTHADGLPAAAEQDSPPAEDIPPAPLVRARATKTPAQTADADSAESIEEIPAEIAEGDPSLDACEPMFGDGFFGNRIPAFGRLGGISLGIAPQPLVGTSWLNRPLSAQFFTGVYYGDDLTDGGIRQQADILSGLRMGWDWNDRWGGETRLAFSQVGSEDIATGLEVADTDVVLWDIDLVYYPTGDTRLRPYFSVGLGVAHFEFEDSAGASYQKELVGMPLAMGLKYRAKPWLAARLDLADNIALPNAGVNLQNNFSITLTAEFHFGGHRTSYWPWNPTLQSW